MSLLGQSAALAAPEFVRLQFAALAEIDVELSYPEQTDQASAQRERERDVCLRWCFGTRFMESSALMKKV